MAEKTVTGLPKNIAASLAVIFNFTIVVPLALFVLEKDKYIRFHAAQALITFLVFFVLISISFFLAGFVFIAGFVLWLFMVYKAWSGDEWEVPVIGKFARKMVKKV
ncbi:MAG TPA: DUF4870 domain-containing protein [Patescibacteria group bacterium]|nr:DUF4870 domain-containing protein [Patescibacteria group bacterium]